MSAPRMIDCLFHMKDSLIHGLQKVIVITTYTTVGHALSMTTPMLYEQTLQAIINDEDVAEFVKLDDSIVESLQESVSIIYAHLPTVVSSQLAYSIMYF